MVDINSNATTVQIPPFYDAQPFEEAIAHGHGNVAFTHDNEVLYFADQGGDDGWVLSEAHCMCCITDFLSDRCCARRLDPIAWMLGRSLKSVSDFVHSDSLAEASSFASC